MVVKEEVRTYLIEEFLPGEDPSALEDTTPLISGGILDSISTVKLVAHLEDLYDIKFAAHEMTVDHLDTLEDIERTVQGKLDAR